MKKITLIGFGSIGKKYLKTSAKTDGILINKIIKKRETKLKRRNLSFFKDFNKIGKTSDAFIVASPVESHFEYAKKIIRKKKPFIIEKPLVANIEELNHLRDLCKNYNKPVFVNHTDLYNPAFAAFLHELKSIGRYQKIDISFGKNQKRIMRKNFLSLPSFDWLPHPIALAIKLAGSPKKIYIIKNKIFIKNKHISQNCLIRMHCKNKIVNIKFSNSYLNPKRRIEIQGSKAQLIYDGYKKHNLTRKNNKSFPKKIYYEKIEPLKNLLRLFYFSIKHKSNKNDLKFAYRVMKVLFKIDNDMKKKLGIHL